MACYQHPQHNVHGEIAEVTSPSPSAKDGVEEDILDGEMEEARQALRRCEAGLQRTTFAKDRANDDSAPPHGAVPMGLVTTLAGGCLAGYKVRLQTED